MTATKTPPLSDRTGPCTAVRRSGTCACQALTGLRLVAGYPTCTCGHTQQVHTIPAVPTAAAAAAA